jgi:hypothetical protein
MTIRWLGLVGLLLVVPAAPAAARVTNRAPSFQVQAYTEVGAAVSLQEVETRARLEHGVAQNDVTLVFAHELRQNAQMTVNLTVAKDAVITGYSYWFKGRRIDAKLLDNDRAWEIYRTVTSRGRDPAIMEQWGETEYHFQIYPVEPGKELKMVIHTVAPWESDEDGFLFRPAAPTSGQPLRRYLGLVWVSGAHATGVQENLGATQEAEDRGIRFRLVREHWSPTDPWVLRLGSGRGGWNVAAGGGTSGGRDGFFYLLLSPHAATGPGKVQLSGVKTWDVLPQAHGGLEAGYGWLITGRYRGTGMLRVRMSPKSGPPLRTHVRLEAGRQPNGPATKLWASRFIKRLASSSSALQFTGSGPSARRTRVVRVSQRFGVVSPYTAWLAIPPSELAFYRQEARKRRAELARQRADAARDWALMQPDARRRRRAGNRARTNAEATQGGDPLIRIETTPDVRRVTAVLPTGEAIPLLRMQGSVWEGRFDIPWGTAEGTYEVVVLLQREDGTRTRVTLTYQVRRQPGAGAVIVQESRLRVTVSARIQRVVVRGSSGERVELARTSDEQFEGTLPPAWSGPIEVTLIDAAHNITVLQVMP